MNQEQMNLLYSGLDDVCRLCQKLGITVNRIPDGISSKVTVDSENGIILFDHDNEYIKNVMYSNSCLKYVMDDNFLKWFEENYDLLKHKLMDIPKESMNLNENRPTGKKR